MIGLDVSITVRLYLVQTALSKKQIDQYKNLPHSIQSCSHNSGELGVRYENIFQIVNGKIALSNGAFVEAHS